MLSAHASYGAHPLNSVGKHGSKPLAVSVQSPALSWLCVPTISPPPLRHFYRSTIMVTSELNTWGELDLQKRNVDEETEICIGVRFLLPSSKF